jgi:hypothetical protein
MGFKMTMRSSKLKPRVKTLKIGGIEGWAHLAVPVLTFLLQKDLPKIEGRYCREVSALFP